MSSSGNSWAQWLGQGAMAAARFTLPQTIQKRLLKFILKRTVGHFLRSDALDDQQLSIEVSDGRLQLTDVDLVIDVLNGWLADLDLHVSVVYGTVGRVTAIVPWRNLWSGRCELQLDRINLGLAFTNEVGDMSSSSHHLVDSKMMTSSLYLAQDFIKASQNSQEHNLPIQGQSSTAPFESPLDDFTDGLHVLAELIEQILSRVCVSVTNLNIHLHRPTDENSVLSASMFEEAFIDSTLTLSVRSIAYSDDSQNNADDLSHSTGQVSDESIKTLNISDINLSRPPDSLNSLLESVLFDKTPAPRPQKVLLCIPPTDQNRVCVKIRNTLSNNQPQRSVDLDIFVKQIAIVLDSSDLSLMHDLFEAYQDNVATQSTHRTHTSDTPTTDTPRNSSANTYAETSTDLKHQEFYGFGDSDQNHQTVFKFKARIGKADVYLLQPPQRDAFDRCQIFSTLFRSRSEDNGRLLDEEFAKWLDCNHLKVCANNILINTEYENSDLQISGSSTRVLEWIAVKKFNAESFLAVPDGAYNCILQFTQCIDDSSPVRLFNVISATEVGLLSAVLPSQGSHTSGSYDWMFIVSTLENLNQIRIGGTFSHAHVHFDVALFERWSSFVPNLSTQAASTNNTAIHNEYSSVWSVKLEALTFALAVPDTSNINDRARHQLYKDQLAIYGELLVATILHPQILNDTRKITSLLFDEITIRIQEAFGTKTQQVMHASSSMNDKNSLVICSSSNTQNAAYSKEQFQTHPVIQFDEGELNYAARNSYNNALWSGAESSLELNLSKAEVSLSENSYWSLLLITNHILLSLPSSPPGKPKSNVTQSCSLAFKFRGSQISLVIADRKTVASDSSFTFSDVQLLVAAGIGGIDDNSFVSFSVQDAALDMQTIASSVIAPEFSAPLIKSSFPTFNTPMVDGAIFFTQPELTGASETQVHVVLANMVHIHSASFDWIFHLINFLASEPDQIVYQSVSNRYTTLHLFLQNCYMEYSPRKHSGQAVLCLNSVEISSTSVHEINNSGVDVIFRHAELLVVNDRALVPTSDNSKGVDFAADEHYKNPCFFRVAKVDDASLQYRKSAARASLDIVNGNLTFETCADSFQTMTEILGEYAECFASTPEEDPDSDIQASQYFDVLDEVDSDAFSIQARSSTAIANAPMPGIVDGHYMQSVDVPSRNTDFVGFVAGFATHVQAANEWENIVTPLNNASVSRAHDIHDGRVKKIVGKNALEIVEGHFTTMRPEFANNNDELYEATDLCWKFSVKGVNIDWKLYGGLDWSTSRQSTATDPTNQRREYTHSEPLSFDDAAVEIVWDDFSESGFRENEMNQLVSNNDAEDDSILGDLKIQVDEYHRNITDTTSSKMSPILTSLTRSSKPCMEVHVRNFSIAQETLSKESKTGLVGRTTFTIHDIEIIDNIESSLWRKFLTYQKPATDDAEEVRMSSTPMFKLELQSYKCTGADQKSSIESRLKAELMMLRMYIDQDALEFLVKFFSFHSSSSPTPTEESPPTTPERFFQHCEIKPIHITIDYKPKRVRYGNLKRGDFSELLNFFHFEESKLSLCHLRFNGVNGWSQLMEYILSSYAAHIQNTQIPSLVGGLTPLRTFRMLGSGTAELINQPVRQYRVDGRVLRGVQKGTRKFVKTAVVETLKVGAKIAVGAQGILEQLDSMLVEGKPSDNSRYKVSKYSSSPRNLSEGVSLAMASLSQHMSDAFCTIITAADDSEDRDHTSSPSGPATVFGKTASGAVVKPLIGASAALRETLLGLQNTLNPSTRVQMQDKYRQSKDR